MSANPRLVGRDPADFSFARAGPAVPRTIGNYWPYATTLFDYINRAMPFDAPGSLAAGDVYSVVAFLLARNGIIDSTRVVDARSLPAVVMPARDHFVRDDRAGGATFR
jgi:cytochrome c